MTEGKKFADRFAGVNPELKSGTLRFFGNWFGKPIENYHTIIKVSYIDLEDCIVLEFDEHEILSIWKPENIIADGHHFSIQKASWLRWVWYAYGKAKTAENLLFIEFYESPKGKVTGRSNSDLIKLENSAGPAVEFF